MKGTNRNKTRTKDIEKQKVRNQVTCIFENGKDK